MTPPRLDGWLLGHGMLALNTRPDPIVSLPDFTIRRWWWWKWLPVAMLVLSAPAQAQSTSGTSQSWSTLGIALNPPTVWYTPAESAGRCYATASSTGGVGTVLCANGTYAIKWPKPPEPKPLTIYRADRKTEVKP